MLAPSFVARTTCEGKREGSWCIAIVLAGSLIDSRPNYQLHQASYSCRPYNPLVKTLPNLHPGISSLATGPDAQLDPRYTSAAVWLWYTTSFAGADHHATWHKQLCGSANGLTAIFQGLDTSYSMPSLLYSPKEGG
jgi:hypothetical protein